MRLLPLLVLAACSDYDLNKSTDRTGLDGDTGGDGPGTDTSEDPYPEDTDPQVCESREIPARAIAQNDECFSEGPTVGSFTPVVEWTKPRWSTSASSNQIMMMPAVGSLTDDDGDGDADADDIPDIVVITYDPPVLRAVSGDGGDEIFNVANSQLQGQGGVALGDIDGDGWTDIVAVTTTGVVAYDHTGARLWASANLSGNIFGTCDNPAISDMDGDGRPEIIVGSAILDNTGRIVGRGAHGIGGANGRNVGTTSFAVDLDGDGEQEVVTGNAAYSRDGTALWYNRQDDGYVAVGNFDADDDAEIVVSSGGRIRLQDSDGTVLCSTRIPGAEGRDDYGGPPTVADFDGDGEAEFAAAAGSRYSVFERDCSVTWQANTQDASSGNTGSSVFDFEGDGIAEAVYADERRTWVFAGPDGSVKLEGTEHSNATWLEYPAIADIDGDGQAEIVVANTPNFGGDAYYGLTVYGDADNSWRSGRRIWNQHAYHITNVDDDGGIPRNADRNWLTYNNFRSGDLAPGGGYSGPDLVAQVLDVCLDECDRGRLTLWVTVANEGFEDVDTDVDLRVIGVMSDGSERLLGETTITERIAAGMRLAGFEFVVDPVPPGLVRAHAKVDRGNDAPDDAVSECIEDNNEHEYGENLCP